MTGVPVVLLSFVLFLALVLNLTLRPAFSVQLTLWCMLFAIVAGTVFYGVGYAQQSDDAFVAVMQTVFSVIDMFLGKCAYAAMRDTALLSTKLGVDVFWFSHLAAFYTTASACLITIGSELLRRLRLLLSFRGDLTILYGINETSRSLGSALSERKTGAVIFVDESADPGLVRELNSMGMGVVTGGSVERAAEHVLRKVRLTGRKVSVFAVDANKEKNLQFALKILEGMKKKGVLPAQTRLTMEGSEEKLCAMLQVTEQQYGFGYVHSYDAPALTARAMIRLCPPWEAISFTADGYAAEDYDCAVIGFGRRGQAALIELIQNGQFAGASFHAAVFAPDYRRQLGPFTALKPGILENYQIDFVAEDGRSEAFYAYLKQHKALRLIAVCTGSDALNQEIADDISRFLSRQNAAQIPVVQCNSDGARYQRRPDGAKELCNIRSLEQMTAESLDRYAIIINDMYDGSERSAWEKWVSCDAFGRMSSRAAADFYPAFLRAGHTSEEEVLRGEWRPSRTMLNALAETEHLRWAAFHYTMGYLPMSEAEFEANVKEYRRCQEAGLPCSIRLSKNAAARTHACLIPWDALDALSEREREVTGAPVDYKQYDINNVLAVEQILKAGKAADLR